jgi:hypothetical protein
MSLPLRSSLATFVVLGALSFWVAPAHASAVDQPETWAAARAAVPTGVWLRGDLSSAQDRDVFRFHLPVRATVLVTLGDLPADYRLAVLGRGGRLIAMADTPGTQFEQLSPGLAAGDYYVAVSSAHGAVAPGRPYRLLIKPLPEGLAVLDSHRLTGPDMTVVTGQLLNNARPWRERPVVTAWFYDAAGRLLATASARAEAALLAPGERAAFRIVAPPVPGAVRHVVRVAATTVPARARPRLAIEPDEPYEASGVTWYVGRVTLHGPGTAAGVHVRVLRYNSYGSLVDFGHAVLTEVTGRPTHYEITLPPYPFSTTARVTVSHG